MSDFRDAVLSVRQQAAESDIAGLEAVLHNPDAPRAARIASANFLARAGDAGQNALLTALFMGDPEAQAFALRAYLDTQEALDEDFLIEITHATNPRLRRLAHRWLVRGRFPIGDSFRLRCYLPSPHCNAPDPGESLAGWLAARDARFHEIAGAVSAARYVPALPLLLDLLNTDSARRHAIVDALRRFGNLATPILAAALPGTVDPQRRGILHALKVIGEAGDTQAMAILHGLKSKNWKRL